MARGINKVILIGNLGQDPDVRYTAGGTAVANLRIATSESWRDKQTGEQRENTEWHTVVLFGKTAEIASQYLKKGRQVYIEGRLQTRKWQDKEGNDRYSTEIVANDMQMIGGAGGGGSASYDGGDSYGGGAPAPRAQSGGGGGGGRQAPPPPPAGQDFDDDDIPF